MAMLAEPRRKQKIINLRAKNNAWSNDNTKFGQRMLEKMGWTSGKGLGANENGITEHVIAKFKNDDKGLGFEDKNDQWTKHEDDFNTLLANLSNASDKSQENLHSGTSLEDKSKKSKARIHYHKFTRGKDISRYSEKDLANIFGKKSFKNIDVVQEPLKEDIKRTEQVFTEKGSMEDYFKKKLAASKSKCNNSNVLENYSDQDEPNYNFCGFSQETDDKLCVGLGYNEEDKSNSIRFSINNTVSSSEKLKKKKKSSKSDNFDGSSNNTQHAEHVNQSQNCTEGIIKKKKKSKNNIEHSDNTGEVKSHEHLNGHEISTHNVDQEDNISKKKRKANKKDNAFSENVEINNFVIIDEQEQGHLSSNKKKKKKQCEEQCEENVIPDRVIKKNSKRKNEIIVEETLNRNIDINIPKKKKKKKCKENI